ncbi:tripartite tricarboxylate transporter substrate binding protein [Verticiella sediminum]|uniref:Tripartite tricarboxylate transporter substrate binding protein n=1 Tax=Verticiella sediminum TaxID=1247510 RepID=A0A556A840_9BURK|nr:tripartite tricarboxylate transporter substrate binding protein [Verticiella sediminum]TSH89033.1 tripartite tricarboxylate transporter substrate binding protein [Verticiella sediminum]
MYNIRPWKSAVALTGILLGAPMAALSATYPSKPITLIVPFAPGGMADQVARVIAPAIHAEYKVPVIVENKAGAGGSIGNHAVASAPGDGYTLLVASAGITTEAATRKNLPYDMRTDLAAVTQLVVMPNVVLVNERFKAQTLGDLISYAREKPDTVLAGSSGIGSSTHFATELFNATAGIKTVHVPYKGGAPTWQALMAGEINMLIDPLPSARNLVNSGKVRALALAAAERSPLLPDLPTTAEAGLPSYGSEMWFGLFAPASTPPELLDRIQQMFRHALDDGNVRKWSLEHGLSVVGNSPEAFHAANAKEIERWTELARLHHIEVD